MLQFLDRQITTKFRTYHDSNVQNSCSKHCIIFRTRITGYFDRNSVVLKNIVKWLSQFPRSTDPGQVDKINLMKGQVWLTRISSYTAEAIRFNSYIRTKCHINQFNCTKFHDFAGPWHSVNRWSANPSCQSGALCAADRDPGELHIATTTPLDMHNSNRNWQLIDKIGKRWAKSKYTSVYEEFLFVLNPCIIWINTVPCLPVG